MDINCSVQRIHQALSIAVDVCLVLFHVLGEHSIFVKNIASKKDYNLIMYISLNSELYEENNIFSVRVHLISACH